MREKNRNSIENIKKLPQFTTMNVIDGQAGLAIYSSLIFYSLTIDNILNIIILLILSAVTISALSGENGILKNATEAKKKTEIASIEEQRKLALAEANLNLVETEYNGVTIPAECAPTKIEGENTIDEGLVVIDKNGNEWVWIEVPKSIYTDTSYNDGTAPASSSDYTKIESVMKKYAKDYIDESCLDESDHSGAYGLTETEYNDLKNKMLTSVYINGGFYIGRYEVGTNIPRSASTDELTTPIIKQGYYPYNYVTPEQAQSLSNGLATEGKTSSLMFGIQWDLVLKYTETKKIKTQKEPILVFVQHCINALL